MDHTPSDQNPTILVADLRRFFSDLIQDVADSQSMKASPFALEYVAKVLEHFSDSQNLFAQSGVKFPILSDIYVEALEADIYRRISLFRKLGDTSLMVSGYFPEAAQKRAVDLSYYHQMGEKAYGHLSELTEIANVYDELSQRFQEFSDLISRVASRLRIQNLGAVELLDLYAGSGSSEALKKLQENGVFPFPKK